MKKHILLLSLLVIMTTSASVAQGYTTEIENTCKITFINTRNSTGTINPEVFDFIPVEDAESDHSEEDLENNYEEYRNVRVTFINTNEENSNAVSNDIFKFIKGE